MTAGMYRRHVVPRLINLAMKQRIVSERRAQLIPHASGDVLEVGIGSGLNLPYYSAAVRRLYGIDPSAELIAMAHRAIRKAAFPVDLECQSAESIPCASASMDTVVTTWTLCSIPDPIKALREMRRVLRPSGRLLFVEHGRSPDPNVRRWQERLNPLWKPLAGGCNLNRPVDQLITAAGFEFVELSKGYMPGPRLMTFTYQGAASICSYAGVEGDISFFSQASS